MIGPITIVLRAFSVACLATACLSNYGMWSANAVPAYVAAIVAWFAGEFALHKRIAFSPRAAAISCAVIFALLQLIALFSSKNPIVYPVTSSISPWWFLEGVAFVGGVLLALLAARSSTDNAGRDALVPALLALGVAVRVLAVAASPHPTIDVWSAHQTATQMLLSGINPFTHDMPDIYEGKAPAALGYALKAYDYPPSNLFLFAPFVAGLGDSRYALIVVEIAGLAILWWRVIRRHPARGALEPLLLIFYLQPLASFAIEQAWTEPLGVGCAALLLAFGSSGASNAVLAPLLGALLSLKQYFILLGNLALLAPRKLAALAVAVALAALTLLPFLASDPRALLEALSQPSRIPYRAFNLSLNSLLDHTFKVHLPITPIVIAATAIGLLFPLWRSRVGRPLGERIWAWNTSVYLTLFALTFGFFNYHYLVGAMMVLASVSEGASTISRAGTARA